MARFFVDLFSKVLETVRIVKRPANLVSLENIDLEMLPQSLCMIHQGSTNAFAMPPGRDENGPDLVTNQSNETDHSSLLFENPGFRHR
jgi:hypothetical protein